MIDTEKINIYRFTQIPSTNDKLWELIDQGIKPPIAAIAIEQTAGRGQWGRTWQSVKGGLYLSLAINTDISSLVAPQLTLFSATGIATALRDYQIPILLKWPNDLILNGKKLGGIKTETRIQQGQITQAVIGVGINWANPVPEKGINLQSFFQQQGTENISCLEELAKIIIYGILSAYEQYQCQGIETLLASYSKLLDSRGRPVLVEGCQGIVMGVTANGELRVRLHSLGATTQICIEPGKISLGYD